MLPEGWERRRSERAGRHFYCNKKTRQKAWNLEEVRKLAAAARGEPSAAPPKEKRARRRESADAEPPAKASGKRHKESRDERKGKSREKRKEREANIDEFSY